jgi:hypothetical protein
MAWRHGARLAWRTALAVVWCLIALFLAVFLFGAFRILFLKLVIPVGPVVTETIGPNRWQFIKDAAAMCAPYVASVPSAWAILYFVRRINRRDDPQHTKRPPDAP